MMPTSIRCRFGARAVGVLLVCAALLVACGDKSAEEYIRDAQSHRAAGQISAAIIDLKNALQQEPRNTSARTLLAQYYLDLPDAIAAQTEVEHARQDGADKTGTAKIAAAADMLLGKPDLALQESDIPDAPSPEPKAALLAVHAEAMMALGRIDDAKSVLDEAFKTDGRSVEVLQAMARYDLARRDLDAAREHLKIADGIDPKNGMNFSLLGSLEFAAGNAAASEEAFKKMLQFTPWSLAAHVGMARAQISQNKLKDAAANLDFVLKSSPNDPNSNYLRALAAFRDKDYATALIHIQRTLSVTREFPPALLLAGATNYALKQYETANTYLTQYVYAVPQNLQARKLLASVQVAMGNASAAVKTLSAAVTDKSDDAQLLAMIGEASARNGDLSSANQYLSRAVALSPTDTNMRTQLGITDIELGKTDQGVEELERAGEQAPEALRPEVALFSTFMKNKEYDKALEVAARVQKSHANISAGFDLEGLADAAKGDKDAARAAMLKARDLRPGDPLALRILAALAVQEGNLNNASQYVQEILKANPKDTGAYLSLAQLEAQTGHPEDAQATLETAVKENPDNAGLRLLLARYLLTTGKPQAALDAIGPALEKAPKDAALLEIVGRAQFALKNYDAAVATFQSLADAQPKSATPHRFLAETYGSSGHPELAFTETRKALDIDPNDVPSKFLMARLFLSQKSYDDAEKLINELAKQVPQDPAVLDLRAALAVAQNQPDEAISALKQELALRDNNYVRSRLALAQANAGRLNDAEVTLVPWIKDHPDDPVARLTLGDIYLGAKRYSDAEAQYSAVLEKNPDNAIAENNLAWLLSLQGKHEESLKHARHAAQIAPKSPEVLDTLGVILLQSGQTADALDTLTKAVGTGLDGDPEIQFHLAQAQLKADKKSEARESLRAALQSARAFRDRGEAEKMLAELGS